MESFVAAAACVASVVFLVARPAVAQPSLVQPLSIVQERSGGTASEFVVAHALPSVPDGVEVDGELAFSSDGARVAYVGLRGGKQVPMISAEVGETYDFLDSVAFGRDAVTFRAGRSTSKKAETWWILLNGKRT